ncbi:MAG: MBL fold metallo-hydrolase [Clostridia bacterium]|nr:MBL fold metallo-hydrolase [Clostridia bacterium]
MKLTFLGTGAGEGYPGFWCNCPNCTYARLHKGNNLRTYSAADIDGCILLDCGPTAFPNAARFGLNLTQVHTLLMTHPHEDHLVSLQLLWRAVREWPQDTPLEKLSQYGGARFTPVQDLEIFGNAYAEAAVSQIYDEETLKRNHMAFRQIHEGESFITHGYRITPVRANHFKQDYTHNYIIEKDGKTLLYALDTGGYDQDQLALLGHYSFNAVIMDGTYGLNDHGDGQHMSLKDNIEMLRFFRENNCCSTDFRFYVSHMSPHWCPPHDQYVTMLEHYGLIAAYDGLSIEV